jgi:Tol biopolymer transport system component
VANGNSTLPDISGDGRWVVFFSTATNLTDNTGTNTWNIFLRDMNSQTVEAISIDPDGRFIGGDYPRISSDGRYIGFITRAALALEDTNQLEDIYVIDRWNKVTTLASSNAENVAGNDSVISFDLSDDGQFVAFETDAKNLIPNHLSRLSDIFLKELAWPEPPQQYVYLPVLQTGP